MTGKKAVNFGRGALFSRLDQPAQGRMVVIMQRLHENDLVGELLNPPRECGTKAPRKNNLAFHR